MNSPFEGIDLGAKFSDLVFESMINPLSGLVNCCGRNLEIACGQGFIDVSMVLSEEADASLMKEPCVGERGGTFGKSKVCFV